MINDPMYLGYGQHQLAVRLLFIGHVPPLALNEYLNRILTLLPFLHIGFYTARLSPSTTWGDGLRLGSSSLITAGAKRFTHWRSFRSSCITASCDLEHCPITARPRDRSRWCRAGLLLSLQAARGPHWKRFQ
jgi:hypothetical protein